MPLRPGIPLFAALPLLFAGCASLDFRIVGARADQGSSTFVMSRHNRLVAQALTGRVFGQSGGLFANPACIGSNWYLIVEHVVDTDHNPSGFSRLEQLNTLSIRADDHHFTVQASDAFTLDRRSDRGTVVAFWRSYGLRNAVQREIASFRLTHDQYLALSGATRLSLVLGGRADQVAIAHSDIPPAFQPNLRHFYEAAQTAPAPVSPDPGFPRALTAGTPKGPG